MDLFIHMSTIQENLQLADKLYFNTGILSPEDKNVILSITKGDNFTKLISDLYLWSKNRDWSKDKISKFYQTVKTYDKNLIPIEGFNSIDGFDQDTIGNFAYAVFKREEILKFLRQLPSIALRNVKEDLRKPRNLQQLERTRNSLEYFFAFYPTIMQLPEDRKNRIINKLFSSERKTMDSWTDFVEERSHLVGGAYTAGDLDEIVDELDGDAEIIQRDNNVTVIDVMSPEAMMRLGCNSMWCFSLPGGEGYWSQYNYNGHVYFIYVDDDEQYVLTFPSESGLYDISNNVIEEESYDLLKRMGVDISKLTFDDSDTALELINKYSELEPVSEIRRIIREIIEKELKIS